MSAGMKVTCPYHQRTEVVPSVPHLLECGCKCIEALEDKAAAEKCADEGGGQVAECQLDGAITYVIVIYVPTAITTT